MIDSDEVETQASWLDAASQEVDDVPIGEYDIISAPNDWNFLTIVSFIESGSVKIPSFQRNYVWDIKRASKLIESLILGLPVPQVFLYEESRNSFLVIDGQQRLLTLYFFKTGRFPKPGSRAAVRTLLSGTGGPNQEALHDDEHFVPFRLSLSKYPSGAPNRFHRNTYMSLGENKTSLDLRTIRNVVVKQTSPEGDAAMFEIFSRLNTGGVNLSPQEIRGSLFHSQLFSKIQELNMLPAWRRVVGITNPDSRMRDTEVILRAMALARDSDSYAGTMAGFVNQFCRSAQRLTEEQSNTAILDFTKFLGFFAGAPSDLFLNRQAKFSGVLFESVYSAWVACHRPDLTGSTELFDQIIKVKHSEEFAKTLVEGSTKTINVSGRLAMALGAIERAQGDPSDSQ